MKPVGTRKLEVYQCALELAAVVHATLTPAPRGHADLVDQLRRASDSIALNIAEGAGEFSPGEKARFYRIARRSASECVGAVDLLAAKDVLEDAALVHMRELLQRILAMLTKLVRRHATPDR